MVKITIEKLALMIQKGFNGVDKKFEQVDKKLEHVATKDQVHNLETRLGVVEKDVEYIKENLDDAATLGKRVDYIENILDIPAAKKN